MPFAFEIQLKGDKTMNKVISIPVAIIAIQMILAAAGVGLGTFLNAWLMPVMVAIVAIKLLVDSF